MWMRLLHMSLWNVCPEERLTEQELQKLNEAAVTLAQILPKLRQPE